MLRSELPFAIDTGPRRALAVVLGEPFLGFLAIVALALALFPMLFAVTPTVDRAIAAGQWTIIAWFGVELVVAFAGAADKRQFLANPWRWLDLATVLVALGSLLPSATDALRSAPILRLARIGRLLSFGVRASSLSVRQRTVETPAAKRYGPAQVMLLTLDRQPVAARAELDDLWRWLAAPDEQWFHVAGSTPDELQRIGAAAGLPAGYLEQHLLATNYPHWAPAGSRMGLFLWLPETDPSGHSDRFAILLVPTGRGLLSLSRRLLQGVAVMEGAPADEQLFTERMIGRVLERVVRDYQHLAGRCEERLRALEDVPVGESRPAFFELTFRLKKQLSAAQADLWRLKRIAHDFVARQAAGSEAVAAYARFETDIDYLYDTMMNIREEVLSVIDLHLNVVSFEMNRVIRVLAVISALGLIPAIVGGMLGMNLAGTPLMLTLPQVAFGVFFAMVISLYFFIVKGWLR